MVQHSWGSPQEMFDWIEVMETNKNRGDIDVVLNKHFSQVVVDSLKDRHICMISKVDNDDQNYFCCPSACYSFPAEAMSLLSGCQSRPESLPPYILDLTLLEAKPDVLKKLHDLGVHQKTSFDFLEILIAELDLVREEIAANEDWLILLLEWLVHNFENGLPKAIGAFVKQILPLEPIESDSGAPLFASTEDKIYLSSEAQECQNYCPRSVGRIVKVNLAPRLQPATAWLQRTGAVLPTFTEVEFAMQMTEAGHLKAMQASPHFVEMSSLIANVFVKHKMSAEMKNHLVKTRGGKIVAFADTYCEPKVEALNELWEGSQNSEVSLWGAPLHAEWTAISDAVLHADYAQLNEQTPAALSVAWHKICSTGYPKPPSLNHEYFLPPAIKRIVSGVFAFRNVPFIFTIFLTKWSRENSEQNWSSSEEKRSKYKKLLKIYIKWLSKFQASGKLLIAGDDRWVLTNLGTMQPSLVFLHRPEYDIQRCLPVVLEEELRELFSGVHFAKVDSLRDYVKYFNTLRSRFILSEVVVKWFDTMCSYWHSLFRDARQYFLPDITTELWDHSWTEKSTVDSDFIDLDDILQRYGYRNWAHPRYFLTETCNEVRKKKYLGQLQPQEIIKMITTLKDEISPNLERVYSILAQRITENSDFSGEWVLCHDQWHAAADLFWEPLPSVNVFLLPELFEEFNKVNAATDARLSNIPSLANWLQTVAKSTGPEVEHVIAAMDRMRANCAQYSKAQKVAFTKWAYSRLKRLGGEPRLILSESGEFHPLDSVYIPSGKWDLSDACAAKVQTVALAAEFADTLSRWGVKNIEELIQEPLIMHGRPLDASAHPNLDAALSLVPGWFFRVLKAYIQAKFPNVQQELLELLLDAKVLFFERLCRGWQFTVPEIEIKPEPIFSCFMNGIIYVKSECAGRNSDFIDLLVSTCFVGVVSAFEQQELRDVCGFMSRCIFKHMLEPQTEQSCIEDIPERDFNLDMISKQLLS